MARLVTDPAQSGGIDESKRCPRCGQAKSAGEFYAEPGRGDGLSGWCVSCSRSEVAARQQRRRLEMLAALGGVCVRCGFSDPRALRVDHVGGDGAADRKANGHNVTLARVRASPGRFQLLCANDNHRKRLERGEFRLMASYRPRTTLGLVGERRCPRCEQTKPLSDWHADAGRSTGLSVYCGTCTVAAGAERNARLRSDLLKAMGGRCVDCGEQDPVVLCVDHVNGDGHTERALSANVAAFAKKVLAEPERYALRCHNCNCIKQFVQREHRPPGSYRRTVPTERIKGPGKGSHPNTKAIGQWRANASPEAVAARDAKVAASMDQANAKRSASQQQRWADKSGEEMAAINAKRAATAAAKRRARVVAETGVHPSWVAHGLERCSDCGTRARPFRSGGLCAPCYMRAYTASRR